MQSSEPTTISVETPLVNQTTAVHPDTTSLSFSEFKKKAFELAPALVHVKGEPVKHLYPNFSFELKQKLRAIFPELPINRFFAFVDRLFEHTTKKVGYLVSAEKAERVYHLDGTPYDLSVIDFIQWRVKREEELKEVQLELQRDAKRFNIDAFFLVLKQESDKPEYQGWIADKTAFIETIQLYKAMLRPILKKKKLFLNPNTFQYSLLSHYQSLLTDETLQQKIQDYLNKVDLEEHKVRTKLMIAVMRYYITDACPMPKFAPKTKKTAGKFKKGAKNFQGKKPFNKPSGQKRPQGNSSTRGHYNRAKNYGNTDNNSRSSYGNRQPSSNGNYVGVYVRPSSERTQFQSETQKPAAPVYVRRGKNFVLKGSPADLEYEEKKKNRGKLTLKPKKT